MLRGSTLTRPDGTSVELALPDGDVMDYTVLGDGRVVVAANAGAQIDVLGADGQPQASYPAEVNHFVAGPTRDTVAWVGEDGAVRVLESGTPKAPVTIVAQVIIVTPENRG